MIPLLRILRIDAADMALVVIAIGTSAVAGSCRSNYQRPYSSMSRLVSLRGCAALGK
jgi:hypothetical protein